MPIPYQGSGDSFTRKNHCRTNEQKTEVRPNTNPYGTPNNTGTGSEAWHIYALLGLQIIVLYQKLFFLFLNQNICCGARKNRLNETVLSSSQNICCGARKNRLNETVLSSSQNICFKLIHKKIFIILHFTICLLGHMLHVYIKSFPITTSVISKS